MQIEKFVAFLRKVSVMIAESFPCLNWAKSRKSGIDGYFSAFICQWVGEHYAN